MQPTKQRSFPDAQPFNRDIARTLFAPLFFSLHYKNDDQSPASMRQHYQRPSPFEDPSSARTAERMLRRMMENRLRSDGRTVCPDRQTFRLVAGAFGRLRSGRGGRRARRKGKSIDRKAISWEDMMVTPTDKLQHILQLQLQLCKREGWPASIMPSVDMYNRILKRLASASGQFRTQKCEDEISDSEQALQWLQLMMSHLPKNDSGEEETLCRPNAMSYAYVIEALASHRAPLPSESGNSSQMDFPAAYEPVDSFAEKIGIEMVQVEKAPGDSTAEWFLDQAEELLGELESECDNTTAGDDEANRALTHAYACLLEGWGRYSVSGSRSNNPKQQYTIDRACELLGRLEKLTGTDDHAIVPSSCYSSVMLALSVSDQPSAADAAEDVLQRMLAHYGLDEDGMLDERTLASPSFDPKDVSKAFSGCIAAHAKNNDAPRAENVLNRMLELYDDGELGIDFVPEVRAFGTCIGLWAKYSLEKVQTNGSEGRQRRSKGRHKDVPSYEQRLVNADRAEAILSELEGVAEVETARSNEGFELHATPYNIAILARVQTIGGGKAKTFDKDENEQTLLHAQSILDHMEFAMNVQPDPYTYSILLNAWCQQSRPGNERAADCAEDLLRRRIEDVDVSKIYGDDIPGAGHPQSEVWPNVKHFSSVLKAHAKTKSEGGAKKALGLLSEMERRFYNADAETDDPDVKDVAKPDLVCYSIVVDAFASSRLPEASAVAYRLLRAVETKYEAGDVSMKPNTRLYTAVIQSMIHAPFLSDEQSMDEDNVFKNCDNNAQRAWALLERMKRNDAPPNSFTYNYIINCAAQTNESAEDQRISFEIAIRAFQELRKASSVEPDTNGCAVDPCHPDSFTFAFMLKACKNLLPPGALRAKVVSQTFRECSQTGYMNDAVLDRLWQCAAPEEFYELIGEGHSIGMNSKYQNRSPARADELPHSWSRCCNSVKRQSGGRRDRTKTATR
ncbi:hypothetical protein ACHAXT_000610 [Thalassiosira profunda]